MDSNRLAVFITAAALCALAVPANAQDIDAVNWTSYYLGLHAGARLRKIEPNIFFFGGTPNNGGSVAIVGAQFGHDWQFGRWVFGLEGDFDAGRQSKTVQIARPSSQCTDPNSGVFIIPVVALVCYPTIGTSIHKIETLPNSSVRFRGGLSWEKWLIYGTVGATLDAVRAREEEILFDPAGTIPRLQCGPTDPPCTRIGEDRKVLAGWTVGLGGEVSLRRNISAAFEYRHTDFGAVQFDIYPYKSTNETYSGSDAGHRILTPCVCALPVTDTNRSTSDIITLRVNYRFH